MRVADYAHDFAYLDALELERIGLFDSKAGSVVVTCRSESLSVVQRVEVQLRSERLLSVRALGRDQQPQFIAFETVAGTSGARVFVCPITGRRCEHLYYAKGTFGSRRALRLNYEHPSKLEAKMRKIRWIRARLDPERVNTLSLAKRAALKGELQSLQAEARSLLDARRTPPPPEEAIGDFSSLQRYAAAKLEAQRQSRLAIIIDDSFGTAAALERAERCALEEDGAGSLPTLTGLDQRMRAGREERQRGTLAGREELPLARVDEYPRLDIRVLGDRGHLKPAARSSAWLDWRGLECDLELCRVVFDLTNADSNFATVETLAHGEVGREVIRLVRSHRRTSKWLFSCPVSGEVCELLIFRRGLFASPQAQSVV